MANYLAFQLEFCSLTFDHQLYVRQGFDNKAFDPLSFKRVMYNNWKANATLCIVYKRQSEFILPLIRIKYLFCLLSARHYSRWSGTSN